MSASTGFSKWAFLSKISIWNIVRERERERWIDDEVEKPDTTEEERGERPSLGHSHLVLLRRATMMIRTRKANERKSSSFFFPFSVLRLPSFLSALSPSCLLLFFPSFSRVAGKGNRKAHVSGRHEVCIAPQSFATEGTLQNLDHLKHTSRPFEKKSRKKKQTRKKRNRP